MAITTTSRLGLTQWSADTDTVQRSQFQNSFSSLETLVAIDIQVATLTARPAAAVRGRYCWVVADRTLWRDTGTAWEQIVTSAALDAVTAVMVLNSDSRLTDSRTPTGTAGGKLSGTYPNPGIATGAITHTEVAAANKDGAAATPSMRTLGTGAQQAAAGNHGHTDLAPKASPTFSGTIGMGSADTDVEKIKAVELGTHTRSVTFGYTGSNVTSVTEKSGSTTVKTTTLSYTSGVVTSIIEVAGGQTVTTTLTYSGGVLTGTTRAVA